MNYHCLIYFKENPSELETTLTMYENPRTYLLTVSSNRLLDAMQINSATTVSFNCNGIQKCYE